MAQKRVIVLESEKLLSAGIYSLLSALSHLEVAGVVLDKQDFFAMADSFQPDVIIMDEGTLAQNRDGYLAFLSSHPKMRTIVLSLGTNSLHVCDQRVIHIENLEDFLDQI